MTYRELVKRVLRVTGVGRDWREGDQIGLFVRKTREQRPDLRISSEMARKLFGEPEPEFVSHEQPKLQRSASASKYVPYEEPKPPPKPDPFEEVGNAAKTEPRFRELLGASKGEERRELAKAIPELAPPHPYLSELENEVLELVYLEGRTYAAVGRQYGMSADKVKQKARVALCYVAFYQKHPERADERMPKCFDPGFQQFIMAGSVEEKRFAAKRHPEIKVMLEKLTDREVQVIHALCWEDQTLAEAGVRLGVSRDRVRQIANLGLRKLIYHDQRKRQWREDREKQDDLIHVLQQLPTLSEAAHALELSPKELLACLNRLELAPSVANPDRVVEDDPRVEALKAATMPRERQKVTASYPELRPPHVFLSADENKVLMCLYWQGTSYQNVRKELYWASEKRIKELEASALEKLAYYLRHQPLSYYQA